MNAPHEQKQTFPVQLAERLWMLGHPYFNLYLVKGGKSSALIEQGISATTDEVIRQLAGLDAKPDFIVVTHPHGDHVNGLTGLQAAFPEARVIAGPGAPEFIAHPKNATALIDEDRFMSTFMAERGVFSRQSPLTEAPTLNDCLIAADGDTMDLGGATLHFILAKGHAPGNLVVYIPEAAALIASDSLGFRFSKGGFFPIYFTGFADYMEAIDRLEALKPEILGLAHQGMLTGKDVQRTFLDAHQCATDMKTRILADKRSDEEIIEDIFRDFYRDELTLYTKENIRGCCRLLVKRSRD